MGKKKADAAPQQPRQSSMFNRTGQNAAARPPSNKPQNSAELKSYIFNKWFPKTAARRAENAEFTEQLNTNYTNANDRFNSSADAANADYGRMMAGMEDWRTNSLNPLQASIDARQPHKFTYQSVGDKRSAETASALKGYQEFADTGGYSPTDIQELRARGISPIRSVYANAMQDVNRASALQGGYAPNAIAAQASMTRQLPGQLADATTNVNAGLADAIRQGKLAGLGGVTGISEAEAGRRMQSQMANQGADIQTQGMSEDAYNNWRQQQMGMRELALKGYSTQAGLYGTTPGMADMFGRQAISANQQILSKREMDDNLRIAQLRDKTDRAGQNKQFWSSVIGSVMKSDRDSKENITEFDPSKVQRALKKLPITKWNYKGDDTKHIGPMAQDFKKAFGVGDGKTIHAVDIMGVMLASRKAELNRGAKNG